MKTITVEIDAWLTNPESTHNVQRLLGDDPVQAVDACAFHHLDMTSCGWARVGRATITLEIADEPELVQAQVGALRQKQSEVRAKAELINTQIETAIQNLLSIGFDAPSVRVDSLTDDIPF